MSLHPDFAVVGGRVQITRSWSIELPAEFNHRVEDGDVCLWRPGITLWLSAWSPPDERSPATTVQWLRGQISPAAYDIEEESGRDIARLSYRLVEDASDGRAPAFYGFAVDDRGYLQLAAYVDDPSDDALVEGVFRSTESSRSASA